MTVDFTFETLSTTYTPLFPVGKTYLSGYICMMTNIMFADREAAALTTFNYPQQSHAYGHH